MPAVQVPLVQAMQGLKQALGSNGVGQKDWAERVGRALTAVEEAIRQHRDTLEDDEGRLVDVNTSLNPSPVVKRRADGLREQLDGLLKEAQEKASDGSREKLYLFLTGWLGGPPLYVGAYGHPRLRARHLHVAIASRERDLWMACMTRAMAEVGVDENLRRQLAASFFQTADWMRNTEG